MQKVLRGTYLEYKNIARCAIYIEFTIRRIIRVDALASQEIYNIYWSIYIAVGGGNLEERTKCGWSQKVHYNG